MIYAVTFVSLAEALLFLFRALYGLFGVAKIVVLALDVLAVIITYILYFLISKEVKTVTSRIQQHARNINSARNQANILRIVQRILRIMIICCLIVFGANLTYTIFYGHSSLYWKSWLEVVSYIGIFTVHFNAAFNAIIFLFLNNKSRRFFISILAKLHQSKKITNVVKP